MPFDSPSVTGSSTRWLSPGRRSNTAEYADQASVRSSLEVDMRSGSAGESAGTAAIAVSICELMNSAGSARTTALDS